MNDNNNANKYRKAIDGIDAGDGAKERMLANIRSKSAGQASAKTDDLGRILKWALPIAACLVVVLIVIVSVPGKRPSTPPDIPASDISSVTDFASEADTSSSKTETSATEVTKASEMETEATETSETEQSDSFETLPQDAEQPVRKGEYYDYYCVAAVEAPGSFVPTDTSIFSAIEYKNPNAAAERSFDIFGVRYDSVYSKSVLIGGSDVRIDVYSIPEYENCELWLIENSDQIVGYISIPNTVGMFDKEEDYLAVIHDITGDIPDHLTYECYTFYWSSEVSSIRSRYEKGFRTMMLNERVKSRDFFYYNYLSDSLKDDSMISASFWKDTITIKMIPSMLTPDDIEGITERIIEDILLSYHSELDKESMNHKLFKVDGHIFSYTTAEGSIYYRGEKFGVYGEFILKIK